MKLRFFLFALVAAVLPLLVAALVTGETVFSTADVLERRLTGASTALTARLEAEAARRRELLLRLTALEGLTAPVHDAAQAGEVPSAGVLAKLREALTEIVPRDTPELLAVVTPHGAQVVTTSGEPRQLPAEDVPLAAVALSGQQVDSYAVFDGALYRIAAAPLGVADGAIVLGDRIGDSTAARLRELAKSGGVTFVQGGKALVSSFSVDERGAIAEAAAHPNGTVASGASQLGLPGLAFLDAFFPVLAVHSANVSLATDIGGGVFAVSSIATAGDLTFLGKVQLFALALSLGLLLLSLPWLRAVFGPVQRQARSIEAHLARLRVERTARLTAKGFTAPFTELVRELDRVTEEWSREGTAPAREPAREATPPGSESVKPLVRPPLDLPLAPASAAEPEGTEGTPSAFPFGDDPVATKTGPVGRSKDLAKGLTAPPPMRPATEPKPAPKLEKLVERHDTQPPLPKPAAAAVASFESGPIPLPGARGAAALKADPFAAFGPTPASELADRTREAMIPEELLARSRELEQELLDPPVDPDEEHFQQVYGEFVAQRKKCGEAADGLTFDKFAARLKKNREQLVEKYNCKTVRFQVYVKEGKAAVKAAPVR